MKHGSFVRPIAFAALLLGAATQVGCYISTGAYLEAPPEPAPPTAPDQPAAQPSGEVTVADFYEPLATSGDWVDVAPYGRVWVPREDVVGTDFVPYSTGGQWVATDQGWVFQSQWENEFGWATYHYGRWAWAEDLGWYWVPDVEWGPAWVDWRYGGAYVGWAPLAPVGVVLVPAAYVFVETRYIAEPAVWRFRVPPQHVTVIYGATAPSHEYAMRGSVRWSLGPPMAHVAAAGVMVRPVRYTVPSRGDIRVRASAAVRSRGGSRAPVRRAPAVRSRGGRRR